MTTAAEFRQYAQECVESIRTSESYAVRKSLLDRAQLWMQAADKLEAGVAQHAASL